MRIVVTGGNGKLGRYLSTDLQKDHEVTVLDRAGTPPEGVAFVEGDVCDFDTCRRAFQGADAIIHLAAIPHPLSDPGPRVWSVNTNGTYAVHEAAYAAKVRRVVQASSDSTLGFCFMTRPLTPDYLPFDEAHPCRPQDPYGLSKLAGEMIGASFTRRLGMETIALRICLVLFPDAPYCLQVVKKVRTEPAADARNLWLYNHVLDAVQAFRKAVEMTEVEHEVMFISAADLLAREETLELVRKYHSEVTDIRADLRGHKSLVNYGKTQRLLGYEPKHNWREIPEA